MNVRADRPTRRALARAGSLVLTGAMALVLVGCSGSSTATSSAAPSEAPVASPKALSLGDAQAIQVASAFGPGNGDVSARVAVLAVRDNVAPQVKTRAPGSHWTSAQVRVCRDKPVILGYPAWVLGDEEGRTAQISRIPHREFPQPPFNNRSTKTGCQEGWVTFVTPADLVPTRVTFEQTRDVRGPWLIAGS